MLTVNFALARLASFVRARIPGTTEEALIQGVRNENNYGSYVATYGYIYYRYRQKSNLTD